MDDVKLNADADDSSREPLANAVSGDRAIKIGWFPPVTHSMFIDRVCSTLSLHVTGCYSISFPFCWATAPSEKFLPLPTKKTASKLAKLTFGSCAHAIFTAPITGSTPTQSHSWGPEIFLFLVETMCMVTA